jgi:archaellum biogenesis protein FlaJ (TadC family)
MALFENLTKRYRELERYHSTTGIPLSYSTFIAVVFFTSVTVGYLSLSTIGFLPQAYQTNAAVIALALFVGIASLMMSVPISSRASRIEAIDHALPDALKYMAVVLRAGGTTESALEEVSKAGYGPLSADVADAFKGMREGRTFDEVFSDAAQASGSGLFNRCANIIIDARRAGAGLSDVMDAIADDAREVLRIQRERVARTMMHTVFLIISSLLLAPFIFGFAISIVGFIGAGISGALGSTSGGAPELGMGAASAQLGGLNLDALLSAFLAVQVVLTAFAMGIVREGKMLRYVLQIPFMVLISLSVYIVGKWFSSLVVGMA